ncbi:MAG: hypothetical protein P1U58_06830, partial [Verrucomicrobiales bacterium]|nr:hypothetical protein [Verrucomicrobiales bacterium]
FGIDSVKLLSLYLYSAGQFAESYDLIQSTLERCPGDVELIENSGVILRILKRPVEAINCLLEAHRLAPGKVNVCDALAHTFAGIGDSVNADRFGRLSLELKDREAAKKVAIVQVPKPRRTSSAEKELKNVISFSLWGENPRYLRGAIRNVTAAFDIYPGWVCRFYCDDSVPDEILRLLQRRGAEVVMRERPASFYEGLLWRFEVVNDPSIDRFLVRDCDSVVNVKERVAVDEWLASDKWFHLMRDYASHTEVILAGMWGGVSGVLPPLEELLKSFDSKLAPTRTFDQLFLRDVVWPVVRQSALCHDSVYTGTLGSIPFPALGALPDSIHVGQNEAAVRETVIVDLPEISRNSAPSAIILTGADIESVRYVSEILLSSSEVKSLQQEPLSHLIENIENLCGDFLGEGEQGVRDMAIPLLSEMIMSKLQRQLNGVKKVHLLTDDTGEVPLLSEIADSIGAKILVVVRDPRDVASSRRISDEGEAADLAMAWSDSIRQTAQANQTCPDSVELVRYEDFSAERKNSTLRRIEAFMQLTPGSLSNSFGAVDVKKPLPETLSRLIEEQAAPRMNQLRYLNPETKSESSGLPR